MNNQILSNQHSMHLTEGPAANSEASLASVTVAPGVRERIVREAIRLFSTKGYNGVSVREIVEAAGITKPSLYYYFQSKEHLFERIILETLEEFRGQLEDVVKQPGAIRDRLLAICRIHLEFARRNAEHCLLVHNILFSNERSAIAFDFDAFFKRNTEMIRDVIAEGIETGQLRQGDPWLMALIFVGAIHIFVMVILRDPSTIPSEGLAEIVVDSTLKGMGRSEAQDSEARSGR